jgi:tetratricopeptide (TPR) repeat protein
MTIDMYSQCPGGCDKKIKFCCGKDITGDLEKILNSMSGGQRQAALDYATQSLQKHGDKECLLALKTQLQFSLEDLTGARETLALLLKKNPKNQTALALDAVDRLTKNKIEEAVEQLQRALDVADGTLDQFTVEALYRIGLTLVMSGWVTAGRAHLSLFQSTQETPLQEVNDVLARSAYSPEVPLLLKVERSLRPAPANVPWKADFDAAIGMSMRGRWLAAIEALNELDKKYPDQAPIAFNIAVLESRLGDPEEMAAAWSQFADTPGVPMEEAVEAEALSQMIDPAVKDSQLDFVVSSIDIVDFEKCIDELEAHPQLIKTPVEHDEETEGPPPRAAYMPSMVGEVLMFGKQTNRSARIEVRMTHDENYEATRSALLQSLKSIDLASAKNEVIGTVSRYGHQMSLSMHIPREVPPNLARDIQNEMRRRMFMVRWPDLPLDELDGKTPRQVSKDPYYKIPLLGSILLLELTAERAPQSTHDFNPLRAELGLPEREIIDPTTLPSIESISPASYSRLDIAKLSGEQLLNIFQTAGILGLSGTLKRVCAEIIHRSETEPELKIPRVFSIASRLESEPEVAVKLAQEATRLAAQSKQPLGMYKLDELELRFSLGRFEEAAALLRDIQTKHLREPNVSRRFAEMLMAFGLIDEQGRPTAAAGGPAPPVLAGASASSSSPLWTPDGASGAASSESKKLWIPGMD